MCHKPGVPSADSIRDASGNPIDAGDSNPGLYNCKGKDLREARKARLVNR